ncbi:MAG: GNAT family N-acetyltransferase [Lachnospiraceae bacterium]|nr:GNAT family N-acetyltransferase [Lachnospiraceae bacterium]
MNLRKELAMEYRQTTDEELEVLWEQNVAEHNYDACWIDWKKEFVENNRSGKAVTFAVLCNGDAVGEGTLLLSPDCNAIAGRKTLCDGKAIANVNALRIQKEYEGKGHISKLMRAIEQYAIEKGIQKLTIGVEAKETRNLAIYLHFGFNEFLLSELEEGELVLYFGKPLEK